MNKRSLTRKLRSQYGFTLLELLVVIAVIGVLASLAVPRVQNQLNKAKFVEVVNATGVYKTAVEMCYLKTNALSDCDHNTNGIPNELTDSGNVASLQVVDGEITAEGDSSIFGEVKTDGKSDGVTYILKAEINATKDGLKWSQTGTCKNSGISLCE